MIVVVYERNIFVQYSTGRFYVDWPDIRAFAFLSEEWA
jgi:hypothetical protein